MLKMKERPISMAKEASYRVFEDSPETEKEYTSDEGACFLSSH